MWYVSSVITSCTLHSYLILFLTQIVIPIAVESQPYINTKCPQTENLIDWANEGWYSERIDRISTFLLRLTCSVAFFSTVLPLSFISSCATCDCPVRAA